MNHHDHTASGGEPKPDPPWLADVEALSMEICGELREIVEMLTIYPQAIANAARLLARAHLSPPAGCPEPFELARELARIVHIEAEIERLLTP